MSRSAPGPRNPNQITLPSDLIKFSLEFLPQDAKILLPLREVRTDWDAAFGDYAECFVAPKGKEDASTSSLSSDGQWTPRSKVELRVVLSSIHHMTDTFQQSICKAVLRRYWFDSDCRGL